MSRCFKTSLAFVLALSASAAVGFDDGYAGVGRPATPAEVQAWDIDVRPDFTGLPSGSGSVMDGERLWEAQCSSCHGVFGESNEVFTPLVGGTRAEDLETGRVTALTDRSFPQRTTMMKVPTVSTLFDYIRRAMPWTAPKSLSDDEVYAVLAYMLNLAEVVPSDFVLSDRNIRAVQDKMPNRNGMTTDHGLWPGAPADEGGLGNGGVPDVRNQACMDDCKETAEVASAMPEHARDAHGNLAMQNRNFGPVRGRGTAAEGEKGTDSVAEASDPLATATAKGCMACHGVARSGIGPAYEDVAARYKDRADAAEYLASKVKNGGQGVWGAVPMPPQGHVSDEEAALLVQWIMSAVAKTQ